MRKVNYKKSLQGQKVKGQKTYTAEIISVIVLTITGLYFAAHILLAALK